MILSEGYGPNTEYIQALLDMPAPTTKKEAMSLIGRLICFRQFLETRLDKKVRLNIFAELMSPLQDKIKEYKNFCWSKKAETAFRKMTKKLTSAPIISFLDYPLNFTLICDAFENAAGAAYMQEKTAACASFNAGVGLNTLARNR